MEPALGNTAWGRLTSSVNGTLEISAMVPCNVNLEEVFAGRALGGA